MGSKEKLPKENKLENRDFQLEFQIRPETGLSPDYINNLLYAVDPLAAEPPLFEEVKKRFAAIPTYESYIERGIEFHNKSTNCRYPRPVSREDFINPSNRSLIDQLNAAVDKIKAKVEANEFDEAYLTKLIWEAAAIIEPKE